MTVTVATCCGTYPVMHFLNIRLFDGHFFFFCWNPVASWPRQHFGRGNLSSLSTLVGPKERFDYIFPTIYEPKYNFRKKMYTLIHNVQWKNDMHIHIVYMYKYKYSKIQVIVLNSCQEFKMTSMFGFHVETIFFWEILLVSQKLYFLNWTHFPQSGLTGRFTLRNAPITILFIQPIL